MKSLSQESPLNVLELQPLAAFRNSINITKSDCTTAKAPTNPSFLYIRSNNARVSMEKVKAIGSIAS
jgi:hypothetical protein